MRKFAIIAVLASLVLPVRLVMLSWSKYASARDDVASSAVTACSGDKTCIAQLVHEHYLDFAIPAYFLAPALVLLCLAICGTALFILNRFLKNKTKLAAV